MLLVDPDPTARESTARGLREAGLRVTVAADGPEALERLALERPSVLLTETILPRLGGLELCRTVKRDAAAAGEHLPVLLLCSRADTAARIEGLRAGADDVLGKPVDLEELRLRLERQLATRRLVEDALRGRATSTETTLHDSLTGLYNARYLVQRLDEEFQRSARYDEPLSIMAIDLEDLAAINARCGRETGDALLVACAKTLARACRKVDVITRSVEDGFVVLLPNTHFAGSVVIAERVWRDIRATGVDSPAGRASCAASVGVACFPNRDVTSAKDLLRFAHAALARAKAEGHGQICLYQFQGYLFQPA